MSTKFDDVVEQLGLQYEVQISDLRDTVWIHASDGSTVGRFSRFGIDLHNSVSEQLQRASQCRLCTHGRPTVEDWAVFRSKAWEWWSVEIPELAINPRVFFVQHVEQARAGDR